MVTIPNGLITDDEETGDQVVQPAIGAQTATEKEVRHETLSPTLQGTQSVQSAIELTVKDLELSEQRIVDKCGEVDFQLSNHRDWNQPHLQLHQDICNFYPYYFS